MLAAVLLAGTLAPALAAMTSASSLSFAGREFYVKDSNGAAWDPGPCRWSPATDAIWADANGMARLTQAQSCSKVRAPRDGECAATHPPHPSPSPSRAASPPPRCSSSRSARS